MRATRHRRATAYDARMLAMADRLFAEFDALPIPTVLHAITRAHAAVRDEVDGPVAPERVEAAARQQLLRHAVPPVPPVPFQRRGQAAGR